MGTGSMTTGHAVWWQQLVEAVCFHEQLETENVVSWVRARKVQETRRGSQIPKLTTANTARRTIGKDQAVHRRRRGASRCHEHTQGK